MSYIECFIPFISHLNRNKILEKNKESVVASSTWTLFTVVFIHGNHNNVQDNKAHLSIAKTCSAFIARNVCVLK